MGFIVIENGLTRIWNPLVDNADAFELAVKKSIFSDRNNYEIFMRYLSQELNADNKPSVATKRAIVLTVVEIGI